MSKTGEQLKEMEYKYIVQIHDALANEWIDYCKFKELASAEDFLKIQKIKDENSADLFRIQEN